MFRKKMDEVMLLLCPQRKMKAEQSNTSTSEILLSLGIFWYNVKSFYWKRLLLHSDLKLI